MANGLREIAETLDVAVSTVSRALSGKPGVSPALRTKIRQLAAAERVMLNPQAQALRSGKGTGLTILTRMWDFRIHALFNQHLFERGREAFGSVRVQSLVKGESLDDALHRALTFRPAAVIVPNVADSFSTLTVKRIREQEVAVVGVDSDYAGFDAVRADHGPGMSQVVRLFLDSGCRNPVFMSTTDQPRPGSRLAAVMTAYRELGRSIDEIQVHLMPRDIPLTYQLGYDETKRLLEQRKVDGLFCFNDELAIGALHALAELGIRVPDQIKVIGFDNIPETAFARVPLTTVNQPIVKMARAAIGLCHRRRDDPAAPPRIERFSTELIVRASAPLP